MMVDLRYRVTVVLIEPGARPPREAFIYFCATASECDVLRAIALDARFAEVTIFDQTQQREIL